MSINKSVSKYDWQFLATGFFLISVFIFTDLIGVIDKEFFYFVPRLISDQPHRIFTSILTHADLNSTLALRYSFSPEKSLDLYYSNAVGVQDIGQLLKDKEYRLGIKLNFLL